MKKLLASAAVAAMLASAPAMAEGLYFEGFAGFTFVDELDWGGGTFDMDSGWNAGGALGGAVWGNWDGEVEISYDRMDYSCCSPNNTHEWRFMGNLLYNIQTEGSLDPYLGGGLGFASVTYDPSDLTDTVFAYQLIAGLRVAVSERWSLFGEYRWHDTFSDPEDSGLEWEHSGSDVSFGARVNLN